jgi:hypothetical protein
METTTGAVRQLGPDLSHDERDACLHALGALHASGKLSLSELDARIEAALAARTDDELAALMREGSPITVTPQRPTPQEPRAEVAPGYRRTGGWLFALRLVVLVALTLLAAVARVLTLAAVALGVGVVRALLVTAWGAAFVYQALVRRSSTWSAAVGRAEGRAVPARLQRRSTSRELVLAPQPRVPAQREPVKIHPVLVPSEVHSSSTAVVLARRSTAVVPAGRADFRRALIVRELRCVGTTFPREARGVRGLVSQLRPLVHRVTDRARWRRLTTSACDRAAQKRGWRRSISVSRTAF